MTLYRTDCDRSILQPPSLCSARHFRTAPRFRLASLTVSLALLGLLSLPPPALSAETAPPLMLAKVYQAGVALQDYWVSEKYDGVRGYWDGKSLVTRGGHPIAAPAWFTANWPREPMDGELWAGRGQFSHAVSTVRQQVADEDAWRRMRFMVFDLPAAGGPFTERLPALNNTVHRIGQPWVQAVPHRKVAGHLELQALLHATVKADGEGLMLHRGASLYQAVRNDDLLKAKTHEDSEAKVVAHLPGKGKYAGRLGALLVEIHGNDGKPPQRFKLGTGLSDAERAEPPPVGSWVTYRFRGKNASGIPRFASFMRVREDFPL